LFNREQVSSLLLGNRTCEQKTMAYCYSGRREEWEEGFDFVSFDNMWVATITLFQGERAMMASLAPQYSLHAVY
jgi:hypothetical protein